MVLRAQQSVSFLTYAIGGDDMYPGNACEPGTNCAVDWIPMPAFGAQCCGDALVRGGASKLRHHSMIGGK